MAVEGAAWSVENVLDDGHRLVAMALSSSRGCATEPHNENH